MHYVKLFFYFFCSMHMGFVFSMKELLDKELLHAVQESDSQKIYDLIVHQKKNPNLLDEDDKTIWSHTFGSILTSKLINLAKSQYQAFRENSYSEEPEKIYHKNSIDILLVLLKNGANPNLQSYCKYDIRGSTALHYALQSIDDVDVCRRTQSTVIFPYGSIEEKMLSLYQKISYAVSKDIISLLLMYKADPGKQNKFDVSPFNKAIRFGAPKNIIAEMIFYGENLSFLSCDGFGKTVFHYIAENRSADKAALLIPSKRDKRYVKTVLLVHKQKNKNCFAMLPKVLVFEIIKLVLPLTVLLLKKYATQDLKNILLKKDSSGNTAQSIVQGKIKDDQKYEPSKRYNSDLKSYQNVASELFKDRKGWQLVRLLDPNNY